MRKPLKNRRTEDTGLFGKIRFVAGLVNELGLATVLVLGLFAVILGVAFGYLDNPLITKKHYDETTQKDFQMHTESLAEHKAQTGVLADVVDVLKEIRCDNKGADAERLRCFRRDQ